MQKVLNLFESVCLYLAVFSTFIMMGMTTADAAARYLFDAPIIGAYEITERYLMIVSCFFGITYAYKKGAYVRVTFLVDRVPKIVKHVFNYFVQVFCFGLCVLLFIATIKMAVNVYLRHESLDIMSFIPLWPSYAVLALGLFSISLRILLEFPLVKEERSGVLK